MHLRSRKWIFLLILLSDTSFSQSDLSIHMLTQLTRSLNYFTSSWLPVALLAHLPVSLHGSVCFLLSAALQFVSLVSAVTEWERQTDSVSLHSCRRGSTHTCQPTGRLLNEMWTEYCDRWRSARDTRSCSISAVCSSPAHTEQNTSHVYRSDGLKGGLFSSVTT